MTERFRSFLQSVLGCLTEALRLTENGFTECDMLERPI